MAKNNKYWELDELFRQSIASKNVKVIRKLVYYYPKRYVATITDNLIIHWGINLI